MRKRRAPGSPRCSAERYSGPKWAAKPAESKPTSVKYAVKSLAASPKRSAGSGYWNLGECSSMNHCRRLFVSYRLYYSRESRGSASMIPGGSSRGGSYMASDVGSCCLVRCWVWRTIAGLYTRGWRLSWGAPSKFAMITAIHGNGNVSVASRTGMSTQSQATYIPTHTRVSGTLKNWSNPYHHSRFFGLARGSYAQW